MRTTIAKWKKVQNEVPRRIEGHNYSEDVVFVTSDHEVHNGFYSGFLWFDVDEHWAYLTNEIAEWIYLKDIKED